METRLTGKKPERIPERKGQSRRKWENERTRETRRIREYRSTRESKGEPGRTRTMNSVRSNNLSSKY